MKKSTSMLEMNELHDVIKFGEDMQALAKIDEEKAVVTAVAAAKSVDDDGDNDKDECCVASLIRQDTFKGFKDDGAFFLDDVKEVPVNDLRLRDSSLSTSPDCVAFMKKDLDNNDDDDVQDEPKISSTMARTDSMPCLQVPEEESKFRPASSAPTPGLDGKESTETGATPPVTSLSARQRLESRRRTSRRRSGSQGGLGASGHSLNSSFKSETGLRSSLKSLDGESVDFDSPGRLPRNVSFSSIEIRSYERTMGDAPTTHGIPVQLDWKYDPDAEEYSVDDYESYREDVPRRDNVEMHMPARHREYLLMRECGFSRGEIKAQMELVKKAAMDRKKTISTLKYQPMEEKLEKTRRMFGKLSRSSSFSKLPNSFMRKV